MLRRAVLALLCLPACSFSTELPEETVDDMTPDGGGGVQPNPMPSTRCIAADMRLCIDFEGDTKDAFGAAVSAANVTPMTRLQEGAVRFATDSSFHVGDNARLDTPNQLTIEMWTRPTAIPTSNNSSSGQAGLLDVAGQYALSFESSRRIECTLFGGYTDSDQVDSNKELVVGDWHHVACTYDGQTLKVYVNGRLEGCRSVTRQISEAGTFGAAIGANLYGPTPVNRFVGELDNVHLYARALSATDICSLWGGGECAERCPGRGGD